MQHPLPGLHNLIFCFAGRTLQAVNAQFSADHIMSAGDICNCELKLFYALYSISDDLLSISVKSTVSYTWHIDWYVKGGDSCGHFELAIQKLHLNVFELFLLCLKSLVRIFWGSQHDIVLYQ